MACLALAACGENELSKCVASTEQIILLRQMALTGKARESFERCLYVEKYATDYCRATWLNADTAVTDCMVQQGYTFTSTDSGLGFCGFSHYENPKCYRSKWISMLPVAFQKRFWRPYNPTE
jgi:hypothetical protein